MDESKWHKTLPPSVSIYLIFSSLLRPLSLHHALKLMVVFVCLWTQRWLVIRLNGHRQLSASALLVSHKLSHLLGGLARKAQEGEAKERNRYREENVIRKESKRGAAEKIIWNIMLKIKVKSFELSCEKSHKNRQSMRASSVSSCEKQTIQLPTEGE